MDLLERSALEEARALIETAEQDGYVSAGWREDARSWARCWREVLDPPPTRGAVVTDDMIERAADASPHTPEAEIREILHAALERWADLLAGIDNLRGHRCNDQTRYLAHVDAVRTKASALAEQHRGGVDTLEQVRLYAEALKRTSTREARMIGADLTQILEADD